MRVGGKHIWCGEMTVAAYFSQSRPSVRIEEANQRISIEINSQATPANEEVRLRGTNDRPYF